MFLLAGNYGAGNLGDEALKEYFLGAFPRVEWLVVSANPVLGEVPRLPLGIRSLLCTPWWKTLRALWKSEGLVFGGGTLFTDTESRFACVLWFWHAFFARLFGKRIFLAFQGVGPFSTSTGKLLSRWVFRHANFISVRDELSYKRVETWDMNKNIVRTFDPVFSLLEEKNIPFSSQNVLVIIPRFNSSKAFENEALRLQSALNPESIVILSLQSDADQSACTSLVNVLGGSVELKIAQTLDELVREIGKANFVLSERYHGAIAALALNKEFHVVPQGADDKLSSLLSLDRSQFRELVMKGKSELQIALES